MIDKLARAFTKLLAEVKELRADVQNMPTPKNGEPGKPGVSPAPEAIAELVLAQIPTPKDGKPGKDADIEAIIKEVLAQIPTPKDGKPGRDAQPPLLADVAALVLAQIPKPKDGVSPDPKAVAIEAAKLIPKPKDGVSPDPKAVAALVPVPAPKQGKPGKDGKSITDVRLERNILSVWIDGVKKRVGKIDPPAQPAQGGGGTRSPLRKKVGQGLTLSAFSDLVNQDPTGTGPDNAVQISLGAPQEGELSVDADGTITVNKQGGGLFDINVRLQAGRSGSSGTSVLLFRFKANDVQQGRTAVVKLSNSNDVSLVSFSRLAFLPEGAELTLEIMRDEAGSNSGGLLGGLVTEGPASWSPDSCASITITEIVLS